MNLGATFYLYKGWQVAEEISSSYGTSMATFLTYSSLIISLIIFIITVAVVYILGIKALVKVIQSLINKEPISIKKEALIIVLTVLGYSILSRLFAYFSYGYVLNNLQINGSSISGIGVCIWIGVLALLIINIIESFKSKDAKKSVNSILLSIMGIVAIALGQDLLGNCYTLNNLGTPLYYADYTAIDILLRALNDQFNAGSVMPLVIASILTLLAGIIYFVVVIFLINPLITCKKLNALPLVILNAISTLMVIICLISLGAAVEPYFEGLLSGELSACLFSLVLSIAIYVVNKTVKDKENNQVITQE